MKLYRKTNNQYSHVDVFTGVHDFKDGRVLVKNAYNTHFLFNLSDPDIILVEY